MSELKFCKDCKHCAPPDKLISMRCLHPKVNAKNSDYLVQGSQEEAQYASCGRIGKGWRVACGYSGKLWEPK